MSFRARHHVGAWLAVVARLALLIALTLALTGIASVARAQHARPARRGAFELRPSAGAFVPTGSQRDLLRDLLRDAPLLGAPLLGARGS